MANERHQSREDKSSIKPINPSIAAPNQRAKDSPMKVVRHEWSDHRSVLPITLETCLTNDQCLMPVAQPR